MAHIAAWSNMSVRTSWVAQVAALAELLQAHGVEGVDEVMAQVRPLACACVPCKCAAPDE